MSEYNRHVIVIIHKLITFTVIWIVGDGWELLYESCFSSHESLTRESSSNQAQKSEQWCGQSEICREMKMIAILKAQDRAVWKFFQS